MARGMIKGTALDIASAFSLKNRKRTKSLNLPRTTR